MKNWKETLISTTQTIREAYQIIHLSSLQIGLVVDMDRRLLGTVTDGDIRRGFLKGYSFEDPVSKVMFKTPTFVTQDQSSEAVFSLMKNKELHQIPLVDTNGCVIGLKILENYSHTL